MSTSVIIAIVILIGSLLFGAWVLHKLLTSKDEYEEYEFGTHNSEAEFLQKAFPYLMDGKVVTGHRRPDGSIEIIVDGHPIKDSEES